MQQSEFQIRAATFADAGSIAGVEKAAGLSSWGIAGYEKELATGSTILLVAEATEIVGFLSARVAADEMEIISVATEPGYRRRHAAEGLLKALLGMAGTRGINRAFLEVRASNEAAIRLYTKQGFEPSGARKGYYNDPKEDAILMTLYLSPAV